MPHEDFRYVSEAEYARQNPKDVPREANDPPARLLKPAEIARQAASLAWKIESTVRDPTQWKTHIDAAPEELRECLREYMRQRWRALKERERIETVGKRTEAGDRAMAELGKRYGR